MISNCYLLLQDNVIDRVNLTCLEDVLMNSQANITEGGLSAKPRRKTKNAIPHSNLVVTSVLDNVIDTSGSPFQ